MPYLRHFAVLAFVLFSSLVPAHADTGGPIYVCFDASGQRTVTNVRTAMKGLKCERQTDVAPPLAAGAKPAARGTASATPADFPKVDAGTQKARDDMRHKVLSEELADEQKLLDKATRDLTDARTPRTGEDRSSQKYVDRVNEAEKALQRHRQNIESLQREIGTLK